MQDVDLHSLECSICLKTINEPKLLTCSHTFCKSCLEKLSDAQVNRSVLPCPICKKTTAVPKGEIGNLQTYQALQSVVDDLKNQRHPCTSCEKSPLAKVHCQECGKYMCDECQKIHKMWGTFSQHQVVDITDFCSGKLQLKKRATCKKHPTADASCFCIDCRMYICFCELLEHSRQTHEILKVEEHEGDVRENIEGLRARASMRKNTINKYAAYVEEQQQRLDSLLGLMNEQIDEAYENSVKRLTERKAILKNDVKHRINQLEVSLNDMLESSHQQIIHVDAATELVSHGLNNPLEKESLTAHDTLCEELSRILDRDNPDYKQPTIAAKLGEKIHFKRNEGNNELDLGRVQVADWAAKQVEFPMKNSVVAMSTLPDGTMALASNQGGVDIFDVEGRVVRSVLKNTKLRVMAALKNGSLVSRDKANNITIYNKSGELVKHHRFETSRYDVAGAGDLAVDNYDDIYVGYRNAKCIQIFNSEGGGCHHEIPCDGYEPSQVFPLKTKKQLLVQSHSNSVRLIDFHGNKMHEVTLFDNIYGYPAVSDSDDIVIAWVKHDEGLVSIDLYNSELKHDQTLIADYKIEKPEKRHWYSLQLFKGENNKKDYPPKCIAFCTPDRMYIFKEAMTAGDA
ncbi:transcription intermediary factor 1-alpha-like [Lytechinus variegatus]|uniref:transcription intermediary factor 1-alpha-like n=1 Tax=Lytechinus variegatus TaxID=7654 RepID=UPI001BB23E0E|nr:transcription intermediary factor 1-alpha-like [Lytechinus variegatus]